MRFLQILSLLFLTAAVHVSAQTAAPSFRSDDNLDKLPEKPVSVTIDPEQLKLGSYFSDLSNVITIEPSRTLLIGYAVEVDLKTGKVTLTEDVDAASREFWECVEANYSTVRENILRRHTNAKSEFEQGVVFALQALDSNASVEDTLKLARLLRSKVEQTREVK